MNHQGWEQIVLFCGFCEIFAAKQFPTDPPGKLSGHAIGYGPTYYGRLDIYKGDGITDPATKKRALNAELDNGRLAMFSIMGMLVQNGVTGTTGPEMWLPSGAFESELGDQARPCVHVRRGWVYGARVFPDARILVAVDGLEVLPDTQWFGCDVQDTRVG